MHHFITLRTERGVSGSMCVKCCMTWPLGDHWIEDCPVDKQ